MSKPRPRFHVVQPEHQDTELRRARVELLWPPAVKAELARIARERRTSINELVLGCIDAGFSDPGLFQTIIEKARTGHSRWTSGVKTTNNAA